MINKMNQKNKNLQVISITASFLILLTLICGCIGSDKNSETQAKEEQIVSTKPIEEQKETDTKKTSSNKEIEIQPSTEPSSEVECNSCESCTDAINNAKEGTVIKVTKDIEDHVGNCIDNPTNFNNIIFDCQGHRINGDGLSGVYLNRKSGNIIRNCVVSDFTYGFFIQRSLNNLITNNTLQNNTWYAIRLEYSSNNNSIINNTINNNWFGISLDESLNNKLLNNVIDGEGVISSLGAGIIFSESDNNKIINNIVCNYRGDDIRIINSTKNLGKDNTCDTTNAFNDTGTTGCAYKCSRN